jgi:hypothetical protein
MRVRHVEYLKDILGSSSFSVENLAVNPGLPTLFPWLSRIASRYEKYRFHKLRFRFETSSATSSTGTLMGVLDYDASDSSPPNKTQLMSQAGAVRSAPWQDVSFEADPARMRAPRFVRVGSNPSSTDVKLYDVGNYLIAVQGQSGSDAIGELYVEYDVELMIPTSEAQCPGGSVTSGGTVSKSAILGDAPTTAGPLPCSASSNTLTFTQPGEFIIFYSIYGTGLSAYPTLTGTATSANLGSAGDATHWCGANKVRAEVGQTVIYDWSAVTTVTGSQLEIGSRPYNPA